MDANQYLKNQIILENCKEYLLSIHFLPEMYDILGTFDHTEPYQVDASQTIQKTQNSILISFAICFLMNGSKLNLQVKLVDEKISQISLLKSGMNYEQYFNLNRTIYFLNHGVCKVMDHFTNNCSFLEKERISYYKDGKLIYSTTIKTSFESRYCESKKFVEEATSEFVYGMPHDVFYERNYRKNTCYRKKYLGEKEILSHNQFDKKSKGVLKRVRKLGQQPE